MNSILLVEDDPVIGRGLNINLELEGYQLQWARDLKKAMALQEKNHFDLIILDLGLPDGNGLELLKKIRGEQAKTPVLILTAETDEDSAVLGLKTGANDYVRKPFGYKELLARVSALLRDPAPSGNSLRYADLLVFLDKRRVVCGNQEIDLNRREFDMLVYFMRNPEMVVTRDALLDLMGNEGEVFDRTIDSHISHLRSRLKFAGVSSAQITTVYGSGYRLEKK